jgi:hypothetical protein
MSNWHPAASDGAAAPNHIPQHIAPSKLVRVQNNHAVIVKLYRPHRPRR